jgi:hypothetical protein
MYNLLNSTEKSKANISYNNMNFIMSINGVNNTITKAKANDEAFNNISVTSLNMYDVDYELTYKIYEDKKCTKEIKTNNVIIKYSSQTINGVNGDLKFNGNVNIRIVILNFSQSNYYVKFYINVSKSKLALVKQINQKYDEDNLTIAAYIYGQLSTSFPTTSGYSTTVVCKTNGLDSDAYGNVKWNSTSSKWLLQVVGLDKSVTRCNVYFEHTILKDAIMADNTVTAPITSPGNESSTASEAVFASSPDDYGTTYYFRGANTNNYVKFANMCWRVVRITGNNTTKIVLYNYNPNNVDNPCATSQDGEYNAFAHNGTTYTSAFNSTATDNAYVGFMYGTPGSSTYAATHANINNSTVLTFLNTWYNSYLSSYSRFLADVIWCNDKSTTSAVKIGSISYGLPGNLLRYATTTEYNDYGYNQERTLYKLSDRLTNNVGSNGDRTNGTWEHGGTGPSFVCPPDKDGGTLSKLTVDDIVNGNGNLTNKIGLLTGDEVTFAGFLYGLGSTNSTWYLNNNAETSWWCMSPMNYMYFITSGYYAIEFYIDYAGFWGDTTGVISTRAVRPSIALRGETLISKGIGTSSDPYEINMSQTFGN